MPFTENEWTILEKLLLSQAVYKHGEHSWLQVSSALKQHALIQHRQSDFFDYQNCSLQYGLLVENLVAENNRDDSLPIVVRLAKTLYTQRIEEIKRALLHDELELDELVSEIDSIRKGEWDEKILVEYQTIQSPVVLEDTVMKEEEVKKEIQEDLEEDAFEFMQLDDTPKSEKEEEIQTDERQSEESSPQTTPKEFVEMSLKVDTELEVDATMIGNISSSSSSISSSISNRPKDVPALESPTKEESQRQKSWQKSVQILWQEISNHKSGPLFLNPIKKAKAPLYNKIVKKPLDLKIIKNKVKEGIIKSTVEFERDVVLMLTNALMYNKEGTETYLLALEMLQDVKDQIELFKFANSFLKRKMV
ncbi:hypothetical protein BY458DRAFT_64638 [Sporodiniella umbellata]|nr:hypothetical protein BY458DRAFT_64638 [Sporodiniella umbellata]